MSAPNLFIIKTILVLWILCVVLCDHQKRDVHHRIIIKQRIPRSHKKGHGHDHKHSHHHSSKSTRHRGHKGNKHLNSHEKDSYEDDNSYSRENSFEDILKKHKGHKSHHRDSNKSHSSPSYYVSQDYEEPKQISYKDDSKFVFQNEWTPLNSEQLHHSSHEIFRNKHKKKRDSKKHHLTSLKPPPIEITTSYPFQFQSTSTFPQLIDYSNAFSNFNLDKKIMESHQSPLIGTIEQPKVVFSEFKDDFNQLKHHQTSYEVTELTPAGSNTNTYISLPDDSEIDNSGEGVTTKSSKLKKEVKTTQRSTRIRGRGTYNRGQKKA